MNAATLSHLILHYRYWILIPLTFIEGPIVAFVAGTLASLHYFNIYVLAILFFVRDTGLDAVYYFTGYYGGQTKFAKRMLKKIGIEQERLDDVKALWEKYPGRTMLIGKLSYGVAQAFIVAAGVVKFPFKIYFKYGALIAIVQYGTLLFLGYFFGVALGGSLTVLLENIQYVIAGIALVITGYYFLRWYIKRKYYLKPKN